LKNLQSMIVDWTFWAVNLPGVVVRRVPPGCGMTPDELRDRTTDFAADIVKFARGLRRKPAARNIADQMSDSATAVAANYRAVTRSRSRREFISKLAICVEEADETVGWLEIARRSETATPAEVNDLLKEAREILAILAASRKTSERGSNR
jgi:four helix bundle protein